VDWRTKEQARAAAALLVSALAPTNTLPGNPAALRHAKDTGGVSLLRGARNLWAQWVHTRSGAQRRAPTTLGSRRYEALESAPGRYVKEK
jgi:poly(3-hydroxyalkanoate) synthetase